MKHSMFAVGALTFGAMWTAEAQSCTPTLTTPRDSLTINAEHQAQDLFQYLAPQLMQAVSGGSATLGQNSTMGGFGHFSIGAHGTVVAGSIRDVSQFPTCYTGSRRTTLPGEGVR